MKTKLQIIIACFLILTSYTAKSQNIIPGYDNNDVQKLQNFFAKSDGVSTNGLKMNPAYNSTAPNTWTAVTWDNSNPKKVSEIDIESKKMVDSLDCSNFTALTLLIGGDNQLKNLNTTGCLALTGLDCGTNQIKTVDISTNTALNWYNCSINQITTVDISKNIALNSFACYDNPIKTLDVSKNTALKILSCSKNELTSLDLSTNTALEQLDFHSNQLTTLDLSTNRALTHVICYDNKLKSLDLSKCTNLFYLECYKNDMKFSDMHYNSAAQTIYLTPQYPFIPIGVTTASGVMEAYIGAEIDLSAENNISPTGGSPAATIFHIWKKEANGIITDVTTSCSFSGAIITLPNSTNKYDSLFITLSNPNYPNFAEQTTPAGALSSGMKTRLFALLDPTGVQEKLSDFSPLKIYPNPATNQISVTGNEEDLNSIKIYNSLGQDVTKYTNYSVSGIKQIKIDISKLTTGIYILKTKNTTNRFIVK